MRKIILLIFFIMATAIDLSAQEIKAVKATDIEKLIAESTTPLILNLWATWCKPCVEEIPYFQSEAAKYKSDSLQLVLISVDYKEDFPAAIEKAIRKIKIRVPVYWLDETNADYFCQKIDLYWSGAVPASLFINNKTGYRKFFEGQLSKQQLQQEITDMLKND